jgi:hypothetical protein
MCWTNHSNVSRALGVIISEHCIPQVLVVSWQAKFWALHSEIQNGQKRVIFICDEFGVWDCDYEQKCRQNTHVEAYVKFVTRRLYVLWYTGSKFMCRTTLPKVSWTLTTWVSGNKCPFKADFPPLPMNNQLPFLFNLRLVHGNSVASCLCLPWQEWLDSS